MIDIGVNLTNPRFDSDRSEVIRRAQAQGVQQLIVTGTNLASSAAAVALAREYAGEFPQTLYCTAGIHPHEASSCDEEALQRLENLIRDNPGVVVAVGETGLDFNRNFSPPQSQIAAFERQIDLAIRMKLPLFLHERDAFAQQRDILRSFGRDLPPAVIHCFTGDRESLESYLDMGLWIGITGWVCDERRGTDLQKLVADIPLERLMIETDAPYLQPRTLRPRPKSNRNEPAYLPEIAQMIADCCHRTAEEIGAITGRNAQEFFGL